MVYPSSQHCIFISFLKVCNNLLYINFDTYCYLQVTFYPNCFTFFFHTWTCLGSLLFTASKFCNLFLPCLWLLTIKWVGGGGGDGGKFKPSTSDNFHSLLLALFLGFLPLALFQLSIKLHTFFIFLPLPNLLELSPPSFPFPPHILHLLFSQASALLSSSKNKANEMK